MPKLASRMVSTADTRAVMLSLRQWRPSALMAPSGVDQAKVFFISTTIARVLQLGQRLIALTVAAVTRAGGVLPV